MDSYRLRWTCRWSNCTTCRWSQPLSLETAKRLADYGDWLHAKHGIRFIKITIEGAST